MTAPTVRPLRKKSPSGELYKRKEKTERILLEVLVLSDDALLARCEIPSPDIVDYVPTECLVYLVRNAHGSTKQTQERIFGILAERVRHRLPKRSGSDGFAISLTSSNIADEIFSRFLGLLMGDRQNYDERLDACEICFDKILKCRRLDAERVVLRRNERTSHLEVMDATGEVSKDLKDQGGSVQTNDLSEIERDVRRIDLDVAVDQLPDLQRQIVHLFRRGYRLYSEDPKTLCISKILKKSDKTIRSHHQQAISTIKSIFNGEKKT